MEIHRGARSIFFSSFSIATSSLLCAAWQSVFGSSSNVIFQNACNRPLLIRTCCLRLRDSSFGIWSTKILDISTKCNTCKYKHSSTTISFFTYLKSSKLLMVSVVGHWGVSFRPSAWCSWYSIFKAWSDCLQSSPSCGVWAQALSLWHSGSLRSITTSL